MTDHTRHQANEKIASSGDADSASESPMKGRNGERNAPSTDSPPAAHAAGSGEEKNYTQERPRRERTSAPERDRAGKRPQPDRKGPHSRDSRHREGRGQENRAHQGGPRNEEGGNRQWESRDDRQRGAVGALIDLDRDLMKLLVRRATLVSRIRGGRDHAASAAAVQAEKAVRTAWENGALAFSKDPRFSRQLFALLQDLKVLTKEQSENSGAFSLAPPKQPVEGSIAGPADSRTAQMYIALAACLGKSISLQTVPLSEALTDTVKACSQIGADASYQKGNAALGEVSVSAGKAVSFAGKSLYLGDDLFTLCLMALLCLGQPGVCRLNGGARLKAADLSVLRQVLPMFGARLAHVVPRSQGLPASLESSGLIPPHVVLPAELPLEAVCALLLAPMVWNVPVTFNLAALPAAVATTALAEVGPLHRACGADVESRGSNLSFTPAPLHIPEQPQLPLDPVLSAYLLALPAFVGGSMGLKGCWSAYLPRACEAEQLLSWAGLSLCIEAEGISATVSADAVLRPVHCNSLSPELGPLFLVLAARRHLLAGKTPPLSQVAPFPADDTQEDIAQEFCERLGLQYAKGELASPVAGPSEHGKQNDEQRAWFSPDAYWSMALALGAFLKPGLQLANPGSVTEVMPPFWRIYNSLPQPVDPARETRTAQQESSHDKPARRRLIAD